MQALATSEPIQLDPNAPGLDDETRRRRHVLATLQRLSSAEVLELAIRAGIYTREGDLTAEYQPGSAVRVAPSP